MKCPSTQVSAAPLARVLQQVERTLVEFEGRRLVYFGGCDYFRLASHPAVLAALSRAAEGATPANVAASRVTTGNHACYLRLEALLARFFRAPAALLLSSGYLTNIACAQALAGNFTHALIDRHAHVSLRDAARFLDCPVRDFRHRDPKDAARVLRRCGKTVRPILLTDGMFSHSGELAPLPEYLETLPASGVILVDDAHGAGVLGTHGRGSLEVWQLPRRRIIQTITLSKAFGVYGGAVIGSASLMRRIVHRSSVFAGNTPLPLPLVRAAAVSARLLAKDAGLRERLRCNTRWIKQRLRAAGLTVPETPSPIVALVPRSAKETQRLRRALLAQGVFPSFIRYPGGAASGYFRFAVSSEHIEEQLERLATALTLEPGNVDTFSQFTRTTR